MTITGRTKLFVILADPVGHVRTPQAFNRLFQERGLDNVMVALQVPPRDLAIALSGLKAIANLGGVVVTVPHKQTIAKLCDELGPEAVKVGSVNAIRRDPDGRLVGEIFDGLGFVRGLKQAGHAVAGLDVLQVGAGGAGAAMAFALANEQPRRLTIANRDRGRAEALAAQVARHFPALAVAAGDADPRGYDLVINATSLGLRAEDPSPVPIERIDPGCLVAEVVMQPEETRLLAGAKARGARLHHGRHMLEAQLAAIGQFIGAL